MDKKIGGEIPNFGAEGDKEKENAGSEKENGSSFPEKKIEIPEQYIEGLDKALSGLAAEANSACPDLLNADGSVNMAAAGFDFPDKENDCRIVADCENVFSGKLGLDLADWRKDHGKAAGIIAEKAITVLLYKFLKNDFLVARTSVYDDYISKVDNFIIDRKTGAIICGLNSLEKADEPLPAKYHEISQTIALGGAHLKYGVKMKADGLRREKLRNLPAFQLALNEKELAAILPDAGSAEISAAEVRVFSGLIGSMRQQLQTLYGALLAEPLNFPEIAQELNREKAALVEIYGEKEWARTREGRAWHRRHGQRNLSANVKRLSHSFARIEKILAERKA